MPFTISPPIYALIRRVILVVCLLGFMAAISLPLDWKVSLLLVALAIVSSLFSFCATRKVARQPTRGRSGWALGIVICTGVLVWYGFAMYHRLTSPWQVIHTIRGFVGYGAHEMEFSRDGTRIAIAFRDDSEVLDWVAGNEMSRLEEYGGRGISDFSSDGRIVSRFPEDGLEAREAYVWNASDGRVLGRLRLPEHVAGKHCWPFFSADNKKIVAACADGLITWDSADFNKIGHIAITQNPDPWLPTFLCWHPITQEMTGVDAAGTLLRIDLQKHTATPLLASQTRPVKGASWSPDATRLATIDREDGSVTVWDISAGKVVASLSEEADSARFSPDGRRIVTKAPRPHVDENGKKFRALWDCQTRIWDATSGKMLQELPTLANVTLSADWSYWLDAGTKGVRIARFDGSELCRFPGRFDGHGSINAFSPDSRHAVYVNASGLVVVWQHQDPIHSWTEWPTAYEFWMIVLGLAGLAWCVGGWKRRKRRKDTRACPASGLAPTNWPPMAGRPHQGARTLP